MTAQFRGECDSAKSGGGGRPRMPKYLSAEEQECWEGIGRVLARRGTFTAENAPQIEIYTQTKARHLALLKKIETVR